MCDVKIRHRRGLLQQAVSNSARRQKDRYALFAEHTDNGFCITLPLRGRKGCRNKSCIRFVVTMYRIRLYIVPEHEEQSESVKLSVNNDTCWWNDNAESARVSVTHRGSKRSVITLGGDTNDRKERKEILRKNNANLRQQEYDLEQKIELEIKMREGTTRLLAACKHQAQTLEAAKSLLTSNERMSAYMAELQRRKRASATIPPPKFSDALPSTARVSFSDLRIPLIWRDTDHFKNKGDYRRFAVFCLARVGTEIYDTTLLCPVDRSLTDLTFPDSLFFNNIPAEFEFHLEVYSHILQDDLSIASTPRKIKRTIHSSISRTVGKKLAASLRDELNSGKIGPYFELMASARLTLDDAHDSIHTNDLVIVNHENKSHQLPLFGHFCCRLAVQPNSVSQEVCSGEVSIHDRELDKFVNQWAQLQAFKLDLWDKQEHWEKGKDPTKSITVDRESTIQVGKGTREIYIANMCEGRDDVSIIKLRSKDEQSHWTKCLVQHAKDHLRWKHTAENVMDVQTPGTARHSFTKQLRQGSLYDETPLIESVQTDYHRPTVHEVFGLTPSTSLSSCASSSSSPTFRERSLSSGGSGKSRSNTLRSHWPFNNKE
ncbi:hypothetical protein CBL_06948 [Carabus blaptoides fortunei]